MASPCSRKPSWSRTGRFLRLCRHRGGGASAAGSGAPRCLRWARHEPAGRLHTACELVRSRGGSKQRSRRNDVVRGTDASVRYRQCACSRVDIYADFQGWVPRPHDYDRFVTMSRRNTSHIAIHHDGCRFTGFTFGRDSIVARLYDKTSEIAHSGKDGCGQSGVTDSILRYRCGALSSSSGARYWRNACCRHQKRSWSGARTCGATRCSGCRCDRSGLVRGERGGRWPAYGYSFCDWSLGLQRSH
jgi:hypothetical protein